MYFRSSFVAGEPSPDRQLHRLVSSASIVVAPQISSRLAVTGLQISPVSPRLALGGLGGSRSRRKYRVQLSPVSSGRDLAAGGYVGERESSRAAGAGPRYFSAASFSVAIFKIHNLLISSWLAMTRRLAHHFTTSITLLRFTRLRKVLLVTDPTFHSL
ncbi:unnamed protein product [Citrullus colocynthis]|uniref:Uncharacterized protein n=1 Tax=Citrullus colocynthis TaxID=252529 RepID=A0ABP0YKW8_9ROSI